MNFEFNFKPYKHQLEGFELSKDSPYFALFWEMGTGKSFVAINTLAHNFAEGRIDRAIVSGKKGEFANWHYDQIPQHWPKSLPHASFIYDSYRVGTKTFQEAFKNFLRLPSTTFKIFVINVESLQGEKLKNCLDLFVKKDSTALIVDESTCMKNHKTARAQALYSYLPKIKLRRILTGTAVTENVTDLWGQSILLKKGILGHTSFTSFKNEYCIQEDKILGNGAAFKVITGSKNEEKLSKVLKTFSTQLLKKDCLDLPEKIYSKVYIDLSPEHRRIYDKLKHEAMLEIGDGSEIEVLQALSLSSKMHQLAAGQIKTERGYEWTDTNKLTALLDILEDYRGKVLIFCPYRGALNKLVEVISEKFGPETVVRYFGGVPTEERVQGVRDIQDPKSPRRFFIANQRSAAFALTLTAAKLTIYYANSYALELRLQSEDRNHRIGQTDNVQYIDIIARDTPDEKVVDALRSKKKLSDVIMSRPLAEWL